MTFDAHRTAPRLPVPQTRRFPKARPGSRLNETKSAVKKRQEIGRGLRLPVDQNGLRVFDESVNKLYVMANESYEDFARALQTEYEEDCGVTFGKVPLTALARIIRVVDGVEQPIGRQDAEVIRAALVEQKNA